MTTSVVPFDRSKLAASLQQVQREAAPSASFLRMEKSGDWVFGIEKTEIDDGIEFAVNPGGFTHGFVCWGEGSAEKLGELTVPITDALPETGPKPGGGRGWEFQLGLSLKGLNGDAKDIDMVYRSSSVGGKRAVAALADLIGKKLRDGDEKFVPVVTLGSDSYNHKKYGRIYTPVFNIERWIAMPKEGDTVKSKPAKAKAVEAKPTRSRHK